MEPNLGQRQNIEIQQNHDKSIPIVRKGSTDTQTKQQDTKSVFVQNVDYGTTSQELEAIFEDCGTIVRVTILKEKATNKPKGCAYVQFAQVESVFHAIMLSGTKLRNRGIKVIQKRTNLRGMSNTKNFIGNQFLISKFMSTFARGKRQ